MPEINTIEVDTSTTTFENYILSAGLNFSAASNSIIESIRDATAKNIVQIGVNAANEPERYYNLLPFHLIQGCDKLLRNYRRHVENGNCPKHPDDIQGDEDDDEDIMDVDGTRSKRKRDELELKTPTKTWEGYNRRQTPHHYEVEKELMETPPSSRSTRNDGRRDSNSASLALSICSVNKAGNSKPAAEGAGLETIATRVIESVRKRL